MYSMKAGNLDGMAGMVEEDELPTLQLTVELQDDV